MNGKDQKITFTGIGVVSVMLLTAFIFGGEIAEAGPPDEWDLSSLLGDLEEKKETANTGGTLQVGQTEPIEIDTSGKLIKNVSATLTWQDETSPPGRPRLRQYENQPDTFNLIVKTPDGNTTEVEGSNQVGQSGSIEAVISLTDDDLLGQMVMEFLGFGNLTVKVTLEDAGMWVPDRGPGIFGLEDDENSYSLSVEYEYYDLAGVEN